MPRTVYWTGTLPNHCEVSGMKIKDSFVDGRVPGMSCWGIMHPTYFKNNGGKLGQGFGQLYKKQSDGRWLKVEG